MLNSQQARREELFNMSIALFQDNREYIIGNAHLPIEDLIDTILQFENKNGTYDRKEKKTHLNRTLFLYGTTYSPRKLHNWETAARSAVQPGEVVPLETRSQGVRRTPKVGQWIEPVQLLHAS